MRRGDHVLNLLIPFTDDYLAASEVILDDMNNNDLPTNKQHGNFVLIAYTCLVVYNLLFQKGPSC